MIVLPSTLRSALLAALAAVFLVFAPGAGAASNQLVFFEAPRDLTANTATDATRAAAFKDFTALGVNALRVNLRWSDVAPAADQAAKPAGDFADPATYNWGGYTSVIDAAKAANMTVLISLAGPVPKWATAAKVDNLTRPDPLEFRSFAAAAGKRFGAANVIWSVWNEPNLDKYLKPAISGGKNVSPLLYRALYSAAYAGLKTDAGLASTKVLFGETAPVGGSNDDRIYPIDFLREALCMTSKNKLDKACGQKLQIDGVSHHPYQFTDGKLKSGDVTYRNLERLVTFLDGAAKAGAIPSSTPVYYTEFGIQSHPDTILGYNAQAQYEARARAERSAYYNKRVKGFSQYLLTDDTATAGFQTGLRYATGKAKPAYNAFRLTLDATWGAGKKPKASLWGLVRNANAPVSVTVEVSTNGKQWKTLKKVTTNRLGAFTLKDSYRKGAQYRYKAALPAGAETSPAVRAYAGWIPPNARKKLK